MSFIPVIKVEFSASLLQSSVSHDPSAFKNQRRKKISKLLNRMHKLAIKMK